MRAVYTAADPLFAGYCRSILDAHGIACISSFETLAGAAGDIPLIECWPRIWVANDADAYRARRILEDAFAGNRLRDAPWVCTQCGERLEPQFDACWRCSAGSESDGNHAGPGEDPI
jgi:hypothetical protein